MARDVATLLDDTYAQARAVRAEAHVLHVGGQYARAARAYRSAARIFGRLGNNVERARTQSSALQAFAYTGRHAEVLSAAAEARRVFAARGDRLRLARLDHNVGNILYRQDQFHGAVRLYRRAYRAFGAIGRPEDVALTLHNLAVCHISLNDFAKALELYQEARRYCDLRGLDRLRVEADYNIAYLYYLRGEYTRAIELYQIAGDECVRIDDRYHQALCRMDLAELNLEINLAAEAGDLARQAEHDFNRLGMEYEAGKSILFRAIALAQQRRVADALAAFTSARRLFRRQKNLTWLALVGLHEAVALRAAGQSRRASARARDAQRFFSRSKLPARAALAQLVLARFSLEDKRLGQARRLCLGALSRLRGIDAPALRTQANLILGRVARDGGDAGGSYRALRRAHAGIESLRAQLHGEGLKTAFLEDKLEVYEDLFRLSLALSQHDRAERAFAFAEQAKSRNLADLLAFRAQSLPTRAAHGPWAQQIRALREELSVCYRQSQRLELSERRPDRRRLERLTRKSHRIETDLLRALRDKRPINQEFKSLQSGSTVPLAQVRRALPEDALIVEYYQAAGRLYAIAVSKNDIEVLPLSTVSDVRLPFRLMQFQLSKFRLGTEYWTRHQPTLLGGTKTHLGDLYDALLRPVRRKLSGRRLIVVPHGFLHYVPFHALWDGKAYLVDSHVVSYAPSASVFALCAAKRGTKSERSLVLGVPDRAAPAIAAEVAAVGSLLPGAETFVGEQATEERLRARGPGARFVHVATHGNFRQDNPMFSSIRLGDGRLSLFDLYGLELGAELVTLSGCGTGLNVVLAGDELIGLVRGLLYAGAESVLATLWDVHDESASLFMTRFYGHVLTQEDHAVALRRAMRELRDDHPHPYHWAAYFLTGRAAEARRP